MTRQLVVFLAGCSRLGQTDPEVERAADLFLVGDANDADLMVEMGDLRVLDVLRDRNPDGIDALTYIQSRADFLAVDLNTEGQATGVCELHLADDSGRVGWSELAFFQLKAADLITGKPSNCVATFDVGCAATDIVLSFDLLHNNEPSATTYVENLLRVDAAGPTASAVMGDPWAQVMQFGWLGDPWMVQYQVYLCVPWQLSLHSAGILATHDHLQW